MARKSPASPKHEHCACVRALEDEVAMLKRRLAQRDPLSGIAGTVKRTGGDMDDYLAGLAPQDKRFMEKKLGRGGSR